MAASWDALVPRLEAQQAEDRARLHEAALTWRAAVMASDRVKPAANFQEDWDAGRATLADLERELRPWTHHAAQVGQSALTAAYIAQFGDYRDPVVLARLEAAARAYHEWLEVKAAAADPNPGIVEKLRARR